jgi:tetratricopeptide (TPR) repeat protein
MKASRFVLAGLLLQAVVHAQTQPNAAESAQAQAADLGGQLSDARAAAQAKAWPKVKELSEKLVAAYSDMAAAHPDDPGMTGPELEAYKLLGDAHLNLGEYKYAIDPYERSAGLAQGLIDAGKDPPGLRKTMGTAQISEGNAYLKLKKSKEGLACYERAAQFDPSSSKPLFDICVTKYNLGDNKGAISAADRLIALDPTIADVYFVKGSCLFADGTVDSNGKFVVPDEAVAALRKYLELAPNGSHASDTKQMLEATAANVK